MRFSEERQKELYQKLSEIMFHCFKKAILEKEEKYVSEWYFMECVWSAELVNEPKQFFLLGALAHQIYDITPQAMKASMQAAGLLTDESLIAKAREYFKEKYGEKEALFLIEKLMPAFRNNKYTIEQIRSMGDKIEIMRGNNKDYEFP